MTDLLTIPDYRRAAPRRRLPRWLTWGVGGAAGLLLLGSLLLSSSCKARPEANRAKCASNLHQIGLAILLYQHDNGGACPDTLGRLVENEQIGPEVFICPASADERSPATQPAEWSADIDAGSARRHCSYVYLARGLTGRTETDATVVAYEPLDNHDGDGCHVLFGDGRVDWKTKDEAATLLAARVAK